MNKYDCTIVFFNRGEKMIIDIDLQHFCCGPKGCQIEVSYGEMMDAE
jgi:hypothetical protein